MKVEIDDSEVVLAMPAPSAEAAAGRVMTDHAMGANRRYATSDGRHITVSWSHARRVNVHTVLSAPVSAR